MMASMTIIDDIPISKTDPDWGDNLDNGETNVSDKKQSDEGELDDWGDWGDFDDLEPEWETDEWLTSDNATNNNSQNDIHNLDGYGTIHELDDYLNNGKGIIELLEHSKSMEQFNYILGMSHKEGHDDVLLAYLKSKNYSIENYVSINVGYKIFQYKELVDYLLSKANSEQIKLLLSKIAYVDENIATIIANRDDKVEIIESNYHLRNIIVTKKIIQYFKEHPDKIDFNLLNICSLDTETIKEFILLGYKITPESPYELLQNNEIMRDEFIKSVKIDDMEILAKLDEEIKTIPGSYGSLYKSGSKEIFSNGFAQTFGQSVFEQMIKYIVLSDYEIDLSLIKGANVQLIKKIYDLLTEKSEFDIQLFTKIIFKFNLNPSIFINLEESYFEQNKDKLKLYFEYKELMINDINDLQNVEEKFYNLQNNRINSSNNPLDLKNVICSILTNQTYFETRKGLLEMGNKEKLSVLKNSIRDMNISKDLDSYIILSEFLTQIDEIDDIAKLKEVARFLNQQVLKDGVNNKWLGLNKKIMKFYSVEANEKMTDFSEYLTDKFYDATDFTFQDGINVSGKRVKVAHIKSGEEYNSFIHVLNAYKNGVTTGSVEAISSPKFIGQAYISLTGISDEYSRICVNDDSRFSIKVLYSHIPDGDMFCAANRDTGINAKANSKNISTRLPANMLPFRRLVRNTETHGSETYNEYDVFRDNLVPSGIAFMFDEPTEAEINAAAYLGIPLVKIDDLQDSFRKDIFSVSRYGLSYDQSFYHIKEHEYENQEITISPNDKYDVILNAIKTELSNDVKDREYSIIFMEKNEHGDDEYFVMYNGIKYAATPVYEYVDSKRQNIEVDYYEKSLIKSKLYNILGVQPKVTFVNCKYPNGRETLTVIDDTRESNLLSKCIDYLVDVTDTITDLTDYIDSIDDSNNNSDIESLKKLILINNNQYLILFESLIKVNHYIEPKKILTNIIAKKEKVSELVVKYENALEQQRMSNPNKLQAMESSSLDNTPGSNAL